eukprot:359697-Chlamydomonas_euryale.AAC.1
MDGCMDGWMRSVDTVRQSQSYRERTHEGYACVERSKAEGIKERAGHRHKGHAMCMVLSHPMPTPPRQPGRENRWIPSAGACIRHQGPPPLMAQSTKQKRKAFGASLTRTPHGGPFPLPSPPLTSHLCPRPYAHTCVPVLMPTPLRQPQRIQAHATVRADERFAQRRRPKRHAAVVLLGVTAAGVKGGWGKRAGRQMKKRVRRPPRPNRCVRQAATARTVVR